MVMAKYFENPKYKPVSDALLPPTTLAGAAQVATLGSGYDSVTGLNKYMCLKPATITYAGGSSSQVAFAESITYDEFYARINQFQQSSSSFLFWSSSSTTEYTSYAQSDAFSQSFFFYTAIYLPQTSYNYASMGFGTELLNAYGLGAYNSGNFREGCGDNFFSAENLGAMLFISLKAQFSSTSSAAIFNSQSVQFKILPSLSEGITTLAGIATANNLEGNFAITAYQLGGNPGAFLQALDNQGMVTCPFAELTSCTNAINQILAYAVTNFPTQIGVNEQGQIYGNPASYGFVQTPWSEVGITANPSPLSGNLGIEVDALMAEYVSLQFYEQKINSLINSVLIGKYLNTISPYGSLINQALQNITTNLAVLGDPILGISGCGLDDLNCQVRVNYINSVLTNFDQASIDAAFNDLSTGYNITFTPQSVLPSPVSSNPVVAEMYPIGGGMYLATNGSIENGGNRDYTVLSPTRYIKLSSNGNVVNAIIPVDGFLQYYNGGASLYAYTETASSAQIQLQNSSGNYIGSFEFFISYAIDEGSDNWVPNTFGPYVMGITLQETNVTVF
jgi:hypothetical protein